MKKILVLVAALTLLISGVAYAGVIGSKHDMRSSIYTGANYSTCQYCHTPHHANDPAAGGAVPLWNRSLPGTTYTLYDTGAAAGAQTLSATTVYQPGTQSLTCLSCHDGTIGLGDMILATSGDDTITFGNAPAGFLNAGVGYFGNDLSAEHPVGVTWDEGNAAGLNTGSISPYRAYSASGASYDPADDGTYRVECGSCHDPHNTTAGQTPFLKGAKNAICTTCHSLK